MRFILKGSPGYIINLTVFFLVILRLPAIWFTFAGNWNAIQALTLESSPQSLARLWQPCNVVSASHIQLQAVQWLAKLYTKQALSAIVAQLARTDCRGAIELLRSNPVTPRHFFDAFWIGNLYARNGNDTMALKIWQAYPIMPLFMYYMGRAGLQGDWNTTKILRSYMVKVEPKNADIWLLYGMALADTEPAVARQAFQKALQLAPTDGHGYIELGFLAIKNGDYHQASQLCIEGSRLRTKDIRAWECLGKAVFYAKNFQQAETAFKSWLNLEPQQAEAHYWLGRAYAFQGKDEQAIEMLSYSLTLPNATSQLSALAWYELGKIYLRQNHPADATTAFLAVLRLVPDFVYRAEVQQYLALLLLTEKHSTRLMPSQ